MRRLAASFVAFLSLFLSEMALSSQDFEVLPVNKVVLLKDTVQVTVSLPCGNRFEGFLLKWDDQQSLRVGVVTAVGEVLCAGFPQVQTKEISGLNIAGLRRASSIEDGDVRDRFKVITPGDIRPIKDVTAKGLSNIQLAYESKCGLFEGFVYRETSAGGIELAVAERISHDADDAVCPFKQEVTALTGLKTAELASVTPISFSRVNIKKSYELAIAPVFPGSIHSDGSKGIKVDYLRNCRQAPVGLLLSSPKNSSGHKAVAVGMVVAEFSNVECDANKAPTRETFEDVALRLPQGYNIEVFDADESDNLVLKQPTQYETVSTEKASFDYLQGCGKIYGAVYSRDKNKDLAVGILESRHTSTCAKPLRENTLNQPYFTQTGLRSTVFPMKIRGTKL